MINTEPFFSDGFRRLYCDASAFESFSAFHPISFRRVLPFRQQMEGVDNPDLIEAEQAHLSQKDNDTRLAVVDEYSRCGLLPEQEVRDLRTVIDFYGADFFDLMGLVYANAGMFRCALRWYRELINVLENHNPAACSDTESVYASVGYCLCSLGLFEEAIAWSKACIGPRQMAEVVCQVLINFEADPDGGAVTAIERSGPRTKYTVSASGPPHAPHFFSRIKTAMETFAPFEKVYLDWVVRENPAPGPPPAGYPFKFEVDASSLLRHRMNLIIATCGQADALVERGYRSEAIRLLCEAGMLEPKAGIVAERLRALQ